MKNLYKLFYKDYFRVVDFSFLYESDERKKAEVNKRNKEKISAMNREVLQTKLAPIPLCKRVNITTRWKVDYPGLLTGTGINHEINVEGEFKLGIHLDYITGMPVIYGSSVKGVLRSAFADHDYILSLCRKEGIGPVDVDDLVKDIFDGQELVTGEDNRAGQAKTYRNKSIYKRDIFFDAVVVEPDSEGRVVASDYITPHHRDVLKDPVPLGFLKIAPGCMMEFRFHLRDSLIPKEKKYALFIDILNDCGMGAKTSVGYGYGHF